MKKRAPPKLSPLLSTIRELLERGAYRFSEHALQRGRQRDISLVDVLYVLERGFEEKAKSQYDRDQRCWKYAIRGETIDGDQIRVVVAVEKEEGMLVITVIQLNKGER